MRVDWDESKNIINKQKHDLSFELAQHVFDDSNLLSWLDCQLSYGEERWINLGSINNTIIIIAINTYRSNPNGEEIIRLISARKANKKEREKYFESFEAFA